MITDEEISFQKSLHLELRCQRFGHWSEWFFLLELTSGRLGKFSEESWHFLCTLGLDEYNTSQFIVKFFFTFQMVICYFHSHKFSSCRMECMVNIVQRIIIYLDLITFNEIEEHCVFWNKHSPDSYIFLVVLFIFWTFLEYSLPLFLFGCVCLSCI